MRYQIKLKDHQISYQIKRSYRAKNLRLTVYRDRGLIATLPINFSLDKLVRFIRKKTHWIVKNLFEKEENFSTKIKKKSCLKNQKKYLAIKNKTFTLVEEKLKKFNQFYGFAYKRISIRNQKTRWGSCSSLGNLNFNYRIFFLQQDLVDYIVVHELCHLKEQNHSVNFWNLVKKTIPDYKSRRKSLRNFRF